MNFLNEIKYFIQRGKRGYSNRDLWDVNSYLCEIIPQMIRHLAKNNTGCPSDLWDSKKINNECHKWETILEEIAQGFEAGKEINDSIGCRYRVDVEDNAFVFKYDKKRATLLTNKFNRGMELFHKYFFSLWD
jgi:hypothetical protein